jgi:hypothetical protein
MMRRDAWKMVGGFLEGIQQSPDYEMWVRMSKSFPVGFIRAKLIELRDHPLQLGKAGQKQMTTVEEELPIFRELRRRLGHRISGREFLRYWRHHRGRQHAHWIVRALLRRDLAVARKGWQALCQYDQAVAQLAYWAVTANGRYFIHDSAAFFDNMSRRITGSAAR